MNAIDTFEYKHKGKTYAVEIFLDEDNLAPWENEDGHGPVTGWETRDKEPGELVLCDDNPTGLRGCTARRFYGFAEACKAALEDSWGVPAHKLDTYPSRKAYAAAAARADYERLRAWCNGEWRYVGVVVRPADACRCGAHSESLWGIKSDEEDYIRTDVIPELIEELEARGE